MRTCILPFCNNRGSIPGIRYFRVTESRRHRWLQAIGRVFNDNVSTDSSICSDHFKPEDYEWKDDVQVLKINSVPTLKLRPINVRKQLFMGGSSKPGSEMVKEKQGAESILYDDSKSAFQQPSTSQDFKLIELQSYQGEKETQIKSENEGGNTSSSTNTSTSNYTNNYTKRKRNIFPSSSDSEGLVGTPKKHKALIRMMHNYSKSPRKLTRTVKLRTGRLKKRVQHLHDIVTELKRLRLLSETAGEVLEKSYSGIPNAIIKRLTLNVKKGKLTTSNYPKEIREFAMTLQFYSSKAYNYVRRTFDVALPSPSVIRKWLTNVQCLPGFTEQAFTSLKLQVEKDKSRGLETICSLILDEMSVKKQIEFVSNKMWGYVDCGSGMQDDDLSLAREALVLMVVAVNNHWKLPIAYFFINSLSGSEKANIVQEALMKLDEVGVKITSITCDGPSAHISMAKKLGAQIDSSGNISSEFKHPANHSKVFVTFDVCHMLKLLRNAWVSMGLFIDEDGGPIDYTYIIKLHNIQEKEMLRLGNEFKRAHIERTKQKMKMNLAAQLFSNSVADALEFLMMDIGHPDFQGAGPTIRFVRLADRVFDLLNSRNPFGWGYKGALRQSNIEYWRPILLQGVQFFKSVTDCNGNLMMTGRKKTAFIGFITTITSVFGIFDTYVASDTPTLTYLLTHKFRQDHLELFFCAIRSKNGWNNNPTAYQFYTTYRRMLMHAEVRNTEGNCLSQDSTEMLQLSTELKKIDTPTITLNNVSLLKKYGLPIENIQDEENMEMAQITYMAEFSSSTDNIVTYLSGFVVRMVKKKLKCIACILALESITDSFMDDSCILLVNRNTNGGLIKASKDVLTICLHAEKKIRLMLTISNNSLPREKNFFEMFVLGTSMELVSNDNIFISLNNHSLGESSIIDENHTVLLIKLIVKCYCQIRWFSVAKQQTEEIRSDLIRKTFSKLILFRN